LAVVLRQEYYGMVTAMVVDVVVAMTLPLPVFLIASFEVTIKSEV